jgi:hypothetical protein
MKNAKKLLGLSFVLSLTLLPSLAFANDITTLEEKTTSDSYKSWTITLSNPADLTSINSKNVYVMDELNHIVTTKAGLDNNGTSITVAPIRAYTNGEYRLFVTDSVRSQINAVLTNPTILPFRVAADNATSNQQTNLNQMNSNRTNSITSSNNQTSNTTNNTAEEAPSSNLTVDIKYNSLVTSVNVYTSDNNVTEIRAKNQPMHYLGGNKYNAGLAGVKKGDIITIDAYNASHKKLYTGKYPVN